MIPREALKCYALEVLPRNDLATLEQHGMGSSMYRVSRKIEFDAAHRLMDHESKCASIHGHRYMVEIEAHAKELDSVGRVVDFAVLKDRVGGWIEKNWDHTTILAADDHAAIEAINQIPGPKRPFVLPYPPSAEYLAEYLLKVVCPQVLDASGVKVHKVTLWETPNCCAVAEL